VPVVGRPARKPETVPVIGLTGGIGSGKSTVADRLVALGAALVDTDRIAHELTAPGGTAMAPIREAFGGGVVAPDGSMDRSAMRQLAFDDPQARRRLEAILHPLIREQTDADVRSAIEAGAPYVLVAVPLLVESGQAQGRFDRVLVVDCPPEVQVERVMRRSGLERSQVQAILGAQASREARLAVADDVVDNGGDEAGLAPQVDAIHRLYLGLSR
jgi:dephospho-CoA kinase